MSSNAIAHNPASPAMPGGLVLLLAAGAGLAAAALYYSQPMLGVLAGEFHATPAAIGLVPTLTQLGYALGLILLAPLGDRYDRRRIILGKAAMLCAALLAAAAAPSIGVLLAASLAIGISARKESLLFRLPRPEPGPCGGRGVLHRAHPRRPAS